jgi:cobalt/nickel transport system permease protein
MSAGFLERSLLSIGDAAERALAREDASSARGVLYALDARVKLGAVLPLILAVVFLHDLGVVGVLFALAFSLAVLLGRKPFALLVRAWLVMLVVAGVATLPAIVLTPGEPAARLPFGLIATEQGLRTTGLLLGRAATTTLLSLVLVLSTRWTALLRALRSIGVPVVVVAIAGMTYRYLFVLLEIARQLFEGRRSRRVGTLASSQKRRMAGATAGALLTRTLVMTDEVYLAMQARGFRGEVRVLDESPLQMRDWTIIVAAVLLATVAITVGR